MTKTEKDTLAELFCASKVCSCVGIRYSLFVKVFVCANVMMKTTSSLEVLFFHRHPTLASTHLGNSWQNFCLKVNDMPRRGKAAKPAAKLLPTTVKQFLVQKVSKECTRS